MHSLVENLQQVKGFIPYKRASVEEITQAEQALALVFADDYREILAYFGIASFDGHELTGICPFPRLNVVDVTQEERILNPNVPENIYVIEQAHIDGIVIWQAETGEVFQSMPHAPILKIANSLMEYCDI